MTEARMFWEQLRLEVKGHAGGEKNEEGHDLVCCAVSTLIGTLAESLRLAETRGRCEADWKEGPEGSGQVRIWAFPTMGCQNEIKAYFRMCVNGLRMLTEKYPKCVKIREV